MRRPYLPYRCLGQPDSRDEARANSQRDEVSLRIRVDVPVSSLPGGAAAASLSPESRNPTGPTQVPSFSSKQ